MNNKHGTKKLLVVVVAGINWSPSLAVECSLDHGMLSQYKRQFMQCKVVQANNLGRMCGRGWGCER